jgi:hypothetical protein
LTFFLLSAELRRWEKGNVKSDRSTHQNKKKKISAALLNLRQPQKSSGFLSFNVNSLSFGKISFSLVQMVSYVKGTVSRDFRPSVFFHQTIPPGPPDSRAKAFLNSASNSPRYDRFSNAKIVHALSRTPHAFKKNSNIFANMNLYSKRL